MKKKQICWLTLCGFFILLVGLVFNLSRDRFYSSHAKQIREEILSLIADIENQSIQLKAIIQQVQIPLTSERLNTYSSDGLMKKSDALVEKIKNENFVHQRENLKDSMFLVRRSLLNYQFALEKTRTADYREARTQLSFVRFYTQQAKDKLQEARSLSFINPFRFSR